MRGERQRERIVCGYAREVPSCNRRSPSSPPKPQPVYRQLAARFAHLVRPACVQQHLRFVHHPVPLQCAGAFGQVRIDRCARRIIEQLQAHGLKPTEQRIRIAELLMSVPTHMTAEQILAAVRRGGERVSKATVYNTLKVLAQRGLVRQIHLDPERSVYDSTRTPHHHFHDLETGELRDIDPNDIAFSRFPALPEGMEAEVEVVIRLRKKRS